MDTKPRSPRRTPYAALLWSAMMPGFGQLYNRDYFAGLLLLALEFALNTLANLNYCIVQSFNLAASDITSTNLQWMVFYPGIWNYSMWQAYNRTREINGRIEGVSDVPARYTGLFIGLTVFMQLGVIWPVLHSRIITGLIAGIFGAIGGHFLEKHWQSRQPSEDKQFDLAIETLRRLYSLRARPANRENLETIMDEVLGAAINLLAADMGNIQLFDDRDNALKIIVHRGFQQPFLDFFASIRPDPDGCIIPCGTALARQQRVIVGDIAQSPLLAGTPALNVLLAAGVRAVQSTPLFSRGGRLVGMLNTHYRNVIRKSELDLRLVDLLAGQAADIIDQLQTQQALEECKQKLKYAFPGPRLTSTNQP